MRRRKTEPNNFEADSLYSVNFIDPFGLCSEEGEKSWWEKAWDFLGNIAKSGLGLAGEILTIVQGAAIGAEIYYDISESNQNRSEGHQDALEFWGLDSGHNAWGLDGDEESSSDP